MMNAINEGGLVNAEGKSTLRKNPKYHHGPARARTSSPRVLRYMLIAPLRRHGRQPSTTWGSIRIHRRGFTHPISLGFLALSRSDRRVGPEQGLPWDFKMVHNHLPIATGSSPLGLTEVPLMEARTTSLTYASSSLIICIRVTWHASSKH